MQNVLNHVSDRLSHLAGKCRKNSIQSVAVIMPRKLRRPSYMTYLFCLHFVSATNSEGLMPQLWSEVVFVGDSVIAMRDGSDGVRTTGRHTCVSARARGCSAAGSWSVRGCRAEPRCHCCTHRAPRLHTHPPTLGKLFTPLRTEIHWIDVCLLCLKSSATHYLRTWTHCQRYDPEKKTMWKLQVSHNKNHVRIDHTFNNRYITFDIYVLRS